jgi:2-polyprenyl-6-methoxyphenol hydroxylase-like FAD-dependent oxidoreductase
VVVTGPALEYWLSRGGYRVTLVERDADLRAGGQAVDVRGTALGVIKRMGLEAAVRDRRTQLRTLSAVRERGPRTYDVALRPLPDAGDDREIEIMRDDRAAVVRRHPRRCGLRFR